MSDSVLANLAEQTGLAILDDIANPYEDTLAEFSKGTWLPRLQLEGSNSNLVKDDKVEKGSFCLHFGKDKYENLGKTVDILLITHRPKAIDLTDPAKPRASYDTNSELFKEIVELAKSKDKETKKNKMFGAEFLLYLPDAPEDKRYCTLHMGNPTARQETPNFRPLLRKPATLKVQKIKANGFTWEGIQIVPLTREITVPDTEALERTVRNFYNPPTDTTDDKKSDDTQTATETARG